MMVRSFVPGTVDRGGRGEGYGSRERLRRVLDAVEGGEGICIDGSVSGPRREGFLNLVADVVKRMGFGVKRYIPVFLRLVLALVHDTERSRKTPVLGPSQSGQNQISVPISTGDDDDDVDDDDEEEEEEGDDHADGEPTEPLPIDPYNRAGRIRNLCFRRLCFRRLSDLILQFAPAYDFTPFSTPLWSALLPALYNLPVSVVYASHTPSLLRLLLSLSSHPLTIPLLLEEATSVSAVFRCIAATSQGTVVEMALGFVDNLLTEGGTVAWGEDVITRGIVKERVGLGLVYGEIDLLVGQFTERLECDGGVDVGVPGQDGQRSAWRELAILCRVSELLVCHYNDNDNDNGNGNEGRNTKMVMTMERLCRLLLPFLRFDRKIPEEMEDEEPLDEEYVSSAGLQIPSSADFSSLNNPNTYQQSASPRAPPQSNHIPDSNESSQHNEP